MPQEAPSEYNQYADDPRKCLANITLDGEVFINWFEVQSALEDKNSPNWFYARLMVAIRDQTWKLLEQ